MKGWTPLYVATLNGHSDLSFFRIFIRNENDTNPFYNKAYLVFSKMTGKSLEIWRTKIKEMKMAPPHCPTEPIGFEI